MNHQRYTTMHLKEGQLSLDLYLNVNNSEELGPFLYFQNIELLISYKPLAFLVGRVYFNKCTSYHVPLFLFNSLSIYNYGEVVFSFWITSTSLSISMWVCCSCINEYWFIKQGICVSFSEGKCVRCPSGNKSFQIRHLSLLSHCWSYLPSNLGCWLYYSCPETWILVISNKLQ